MRKESPSCRWNALGTSKFVNASSCLKVKNGASPNIINDLSREYIKVHSTSVMFSE